MAGERSVRSGQQLIREIRSRVEEVDPAEVKRALDRGQENGSAQDAPVIVDVREQHEFERGHLPGAVHVPRSYLESRIEGTVPDRDRRIILYCATGQRSALAANTLEEELGYESVASMNGGFTLWRDRGFPFVQPRVLT